jgi:exosome complex component RRP42
MKKLCIEEGEKVWMLFVDISILDNFGNLIDAAALASASALTKVVFPKYEDGAVVFTEKTNKKLPLKFRPVACTFSLIGNHLLIDPNREEEDAASARLTITTRDDNNVVAIQKGGNGKLTVENINKALDLAVERGKEIRKLIK